MRKFLLAALGLVGTSVIHAHAADLPARAAPAPDYVVNPVYNWAGFYLGGFANGRWSTADDRTGAPAADFTGFAGGLIGGGNFQFGNFVFGVEGDGGSGAGHGSNLTAGGVITSVDLETTGHLRARAGYAFDRVLVFVAGGLSAVDAELSRTGATNTLKDTIYGWTIGGGVDYALYRNFILRLEYLYESYPDKQFVFSPTVQNALSINSNVLRGAAMFKF
jgi:outer membrane immunogenic protein